MPDPANPGRARRSWTAILLCIILTAASARVHADALAQAAGSYRIDPSSSISFEVGQVGGGGIRGEFSRFIGSFRIDGSNVAKSSVSFTLYPDSVRTGEPRVETFLRSDAVFDVASHPTITFQSVRVTQVDADEARIDGTLTARGISRQARFDVRVSDRRGKRLSFHVTGAIYRSPYGMDVGTPIYSNVVRFDMALTGTRR